MSIQKNEFFEMEQKKIMEIHNKYSVRDKDGHVHCFECPYSAHNYYHCDCLFAKQFEDVDGRRV